MNRRKKRTANNLSSSSCEVTETASEWRGSFGIQLLPPDIIMDILSRLPVKTIVYCKRVCKDWLRLISHRRFVELQLARSSPAMLNQTVTCKISLTHLEQRGRAPFRRDKLVLTPKSNLPIFSFRLVNSCNGLLCLSWEDNQESILVCNPILREYVTIPSASKGRNRWSFTALGFCSVANRYKLLQTFYPNNRTWDGSPAAEIYDMDTGTRRSIGHAPFAYVTLPFNSLLRGSLHWVCPFGKVAVAGYIFSFNFETEEFGSVPPPPCLDLDDTQSQFFDYYFSLGIVECCLFLCVFGDDSSQFDIWVMKDYGVKESWTKQFVIKNVDPKGCNPCIYEPIKFLNNGEILMLSNSLVVDCYNTQTKTFRETSINRTRCDFQSIAHTPSLVSLYHVAKGELVERFQGLSAEGTVDCDGFGTSPNVPARFNSTQDQGHLGDSFFFVRSHSI